MAIRRRYTERVSERWRHNQLKSQSIACGNGRCFDTYGFAHHQLSLVYSFIVLPLLGVWGFLVMKLFFWKYFEWWLLICLLIISRQNTKLPMLLCDKNFIFNSRKEENGRANFGCHWKNKSRIRRSFPLKPKSLF